MGNIGGRYHLDEQLGSGGFGRVWRARDRRLGVPVALKELRLPATLAEADRTERLTRAAREARNAARLRDHPDIATVYDVVVEDEVPWIVMQLADGGSLADRIAAGGPLPVDEVADIARSLLRALGAAHTAGVVHRDVKPANVLLTDEGRALLTDFGIAVHREDTTLTVTGALLGSVEYVAPERARGRSAPPGDLFSLGVTLYEAVEGVSPFRRESATETLTAVLFDPVPPPRRAGRLAPLLTGLLAKDPADRPTVEDALAALDAADAPEGREAPHEPAGPADPDRPGRDRPGDAGETARGPGDAGDTTVTVPEPGAPGRRKGARAWQARASLLTLLLMCPAAWVGIAVGWGPVETALRPLDLNPQRPMITLLVAAGLAAGAVTATVLMRFVQAGLARAVRALGSTVTWAVYTVTAAVGALLPCAAYLGTVRTLGEVLPLWGAIWTALGLIAALVALAFGWQKEALPAAAGPK
ncbi:serine/threonine-protein kinase [Streptomyces carpaticus]|uniref:non-specific serine/threonine protein kinase n=1 Tax=Streptomyces carpaticus TaxID=285558 RepID=A0ABV4ZGW2_9ACTN